MRKYFDRLARRLVPAVPVLSRRPILMACLDLLDKVLSLPFPEFRDLPPNRFRIRVGVGNRLMFNQAQFLEYGASTALELMSAGLLETGSRVVDIGCGCGRLPHALRRFGFKGVYTGIDVDREMIEWCRDHFPSTNFRFYHANVYSAVYNPGGQKGQYSLPLDHELQDLVVGQSLLTHLLEPEVHHYLRESFRVLEPGGSLYMGVFCLDDMRELELLGGRWTFEEKIGAAYVQDPQFPEAAVAYTRDHLEHLTHDTGFSEVKIVPGEQSLLICRK